MARVAEWAWPFVWAYAGDHLQTEGLWQNGLTRFTVSDWHRAAVKALELPAYQLKIARPRWAVRMLRGGAPIHVVRAQLGHSTAKLTLDTYGWCLRGARFGPERRSR
jgi:integrase